MHEEPSHCEDMHIGLKEKDEETSEMVEGGQRSKTLLDKPPDIHIGGSSMHHIEGVRVNLERANATEGLIPRKARGFSGGIWCLWDTEVQKVDILHHHMQFIHMKITGRDNPPWAFTAVYGDFNAILHNFERKGGSTDHNRRACSNFRNCLSECGLIDLGRPSRLGIIMSLEISKEGKEFYLGRHRADQERSSPKLGLGMATGPHGGGDMPPAPAPRPQYLSPSPPRPHDG
ncbi:hypothetical protein Ahy_B10g105116 [Arachis hypogaea]|uniref:Uncharacterized protein n=1 Tax=Arachis hypogaea TaxID=3818 RepID=A0A444X769_ARAHY|nr:hypothetical protein Ahy_B10g105116 [Arachis hypogaea]